MIRNSLNTPHKCWFCSYDNPSYVSKCERCGGLTLPTRDRNGKKVEWSIYSFGSSAPASEKCSAAFYPSSREILDQRDKTAIRVAAGKRTVLLARYPQRGKSYSIRRENGTIETGDWDEKNDENKTPFLRVVNEILAGEEKEASHK